MNGAVICIILMISGNFGLKPVVDCARHMLSDGQPTVGHATIVLRKWVVLTLTAWSYVEQMRAGTMWMLAYHDWREHEVAAALEADVDRFFLHRVSVMLRCTGSGHMRP